jgi:flagellar hook assembly protein FlgD
VFHQPWPNPARTSLSISYALPRASHVTVKLYDIAGKLQRTLKSEQQKPGLYRLTWDRRDQKGRTVAAGIYFCQVESGKERQQKKVVLAE